MAGHPRRTALRFLVAGLVVVHHETLVSSRATASCSVLCFKPGVTISLVIPPETWCTCSYSLGLTGPLYLEVTVSPSRYCQ